MNAFFREKEFKSIYTYAYLNKKRLNIFLENFSVMLKSFKFIRFSFELKSFNFSIIKHNHNNCLVFSRQINKMPRYEYPKIRRDEMIVENLHGMEVLIYYPE